MGDRVLVQFTNNNDVVSPVCYLHWSGPDAPNLIRECAALMIGRDGDVYYSFARFVGIAHNHVSGNLSLGVWNQTRKLRETDSHGDAGCYVVNCEDWNVEAFGGYGTPFNARG